MSSSFLTNKGQVTIPCKLRQKLLLQPGDKVIFEEKDGVITITPANEDIESIAGCLTNDTHHTATLEDMQQAIENGTQ